MARDSSPQCKQCRRENVKLFLKGERCLTDKCAVERRSYPPGEHGRGRIKQSEYLLQLREKQKARRYYQVLEKQFHNLFEVVIQLIHGFPLGMGAAQTWNVTDIKPCIGTLLNNGGINSHWLPLLCIYQQSFNHKQRLHDE